VFRVLTVLLGLALGLGAFGWPSLIAPWFATGTQVVHRVHNLGYGNLGYGALVGILLAAPLVLQARRPEERPAAMQQALVVAAAMVVAEVLSSDFDPFVPAVLLVLVIVATMHPARRDLARVEGPPSVALAVPAVAASIPLVWFALHEASLQRNGSPAYPHVRMHHWTTMAGLGIGIATVALLAAGRPRGWRIPAWCAGLAAVAYGLASVAYPAYAGASGRGWGAVAVGSGAAFVAVAEIESRLARRPRALG
jgi:hypothetical protein